MRSTDSTLPPCCGSRQGRPGKLGGLPARGGLERGWEREEMKPRRPSRGGVRSWGPSLSWSSRPVGAAKQPRVAGVIRWSGVERDGPQVHAGLDTSGRWGARDSFGHRSDGHHGNRTRGSATASVQYALCWSCLDSSFPALGRPSFQFLFPPSRVGPGGGCTAQVGLDSGGGVSEGRGGRRSRRGSGVRSCWSLVEREAARGSRKGDRDSRGGRGGLSSAGKPE